MISAKIEKEANSDWNVHLLDSPLGSIYQTKEYGSYVKSRLKSDTLFIKFYTSNDELVGQLLTFQSFLGRRKIAKLFGRGSIYSAFAKTSSLLPKYTNWVFGPIVFNRMYLYEISKSLAELLTSWRGKFYGVSHPLDTNFSNKFNFTKKEAATFIINLDSDLENIFSNTDKKSVQKNIKRAEERGVTVTQISSDKDLLIYHELLNKHRSEKKLDSYSQADVTELYKFLKPVGQKGFLAWYNEIPIGGIFFSTFNKYINEWGIARSQFDTEKKLYSLDLLRWKVIEWGKQNNCKYYDLSGVMSTNRSAKEEALFRNKKKWGGKLITYPIFLK